MKMVDEFLSCGNIKKVLTVEPPPIKRPVIYVTKIRELSLHDYAVKMPNFTFCRGGEHLTTISFFFS